MQVGPYTKRTLAYVSPLDKARPHEVVWNEVNTLFDAARGYQGITFVYFVGEAGDGPMKIGVSKDPITRLRSMQTGNPRRLRIERVLAGSVLTEKLLHELWEPHAIYSATSAGKVGAAPGTEWFAPVVRTDLFPIVSDAKARQIARLREGGNVTAMECDRHVRDAHTDSGFVAKGIDETALMAAGAGRVYVGRRSRI